MTMRLYSLANAVPQSHLYALMKSGRAHEECRLECMKYSLRLDETFHIGLPQTQHTNKCTFRPFLRQALARTHATMMDFPKAFDSFRYHFCGTDV